MSDVPPPPPDDWGRLPEPPPPPPDDPGWLPEPPPPPPDDSGWSSQLPPSPPLEGPLTAGGVPNARSADLGTGETVALASPGTRLAARLVDLLVGGVLLAVVGRMGAPLASTGGVIVGAVYEIAFIATKGQTPGKMATLIRIVRAADGAIPAWGASAARWALPAVASVAGPFILAAGVESAAVSLLSVIGVVVYVSLLWDKRRQGWHDKVARTLVINTPTQTALSNRVAIGLGIAGAVPLALLVALAIIWILASLGL